MPMVRHVMIGRAYTSTQDLLQSFRHNLLLKLSTSTKARAQLSSLKPLRLRTGAPPHH